MVGINFQLMESMGIGEFNVIYLLLNGHMFILRNIYLQVILFLIGCFKLCFSN